MESLHNAEVKIERQLHNGSDIKAASQLLDEFQKNPQLAMQLVKSESIRAQYADDKFHVGVAQNGDVFIYNKDESNGMYAGHMPGDGAVRQAQAPAPLPPLKEVYVAPSPPAVPLQESVPLSLPAETAAGRPGPHIPFPIDIGVEDGTLHIGLNAFGLGKAGIELGEHTGGYAGSDVLRTEAHGDFDLSPSHIGPSARWTVLDGHLTAGEARVGIDPRCHGADIGGSVDAEAFDSNVTAGGGAALELGHHVGPKAGAYAAVGPFDAGANGYANLSDRGIQAGADGKVEAQHVLSVQDKTRAGLGAANEAYSDAGLTVGDDGRMSVGAGVYRDFSPNVYGRVGNARLGLGANPAAAWRTAPNYYDDPNS
jgi:hypothetical protein